MVTFESDENCPIQFYGQVFNSTWNEKTLFAQHYNSK